MPQPKKKVNDLLDTLSRLAKSKNPDPMALRRIEKDAEQLLKTDAAAGYTALGVVAALKGNEKALRENHEKSLRLADNAVTRENYGNSLAYLHLMKEALAQFDKALMHVLTPALLMKSLRFSVQSGYPNRALAYHEKLFKLIPDLQDDELDNLMKTAEILLKAGMTDDEMAEVNALAQQVINEFGVEVEGSRVWLGWWDDGSPLVVNDIRVKADLSTVVDMDEKLIELKIDADTEAVKNLNYLVSFEVANEHSTH